MSGDQYVDLRPDDTRDVTVEWQGAWYAGELEAYLRSGEAWSGFVRFKTGIGEMRIDWFPAERIRKTG